MAVLYRKYRPQTFAEVIGQEAIVQTLKNAIAHKTPAHAYLFTGTRGVGKTTVARLVAKSVNCLNGKDGEACLKCVICASVAEGTFMDMVEIDAASNTGVENVRELIEHVKFQPTQGTYKVFIIDEVHMLSKQAFNALLKTLEEPPAHVIFILATTEIYKVPVTIISRTQRFDFAALSQSMIADHLRLVLKKEKQKIPEELVGMIAVQAAGSARDALSLLDKVLALGDSLSANDAKVLLGITDFATHAELFQLMSSRDTANIPAYFERLLQQGTDFTILNKDFLEFLRKALVIKITGNSVVHGLSEEQSSTLDELVQAISIGQLVKLVRLFLRAYKDATTAVSPELPMLLASVEAAFVESGMTSTPLNASPAPAITTKTQLQPEQTKPSNIILEEVMVVAEVPQAEVAMSETIGDKSALDLTHELVSGFWPSVIQKIKEVNSPLATLVKNSPLESVENGIITLQVKYRFHKEHLESTKHYALLSAIIEEVCGKRPQIVIVVRAEDTPVNTAEALGSVLQVFGGELVE